MSTNEEVPPKWEDTQPVDDQPPKWEDTQPVEEDTQGQQDWQSKPNLSPLEVAGYAGADALRRASMVINPAFKAAGLAGAALRTGATAAMSGVDRALENYSADRPITEGVGTAMGIGGGINAGLEAAVASAIPAGKLAMKGGRWVMDQAAESLFDGKLTQEMLKSPVVQDTIDKIVSFKGAMGLGGNLKTRASGAADDAAKVYTQAVGNITDEAMPISKVLPDEVLNNLDVGPLDNKVRSQLPNYKNKIIENLEPVRLKNERLDMEAQQRSSTLNRREELRRLIEEKRSAKLAPIQSKFDEDLLAAKQLDLEKANQAATNTSGTANEAEYLKRKAELEGIIPQSNEELISRNNELRQLERQFKTRNMREGFEEPSMAELTRKEFEAQKSLAESQLAPEINPLYQSLQDIGKEIQPPIPKQTTLREAYNVANTPIKGEINPLTDTLGARVRELGGESVAAADLAKQNSDTLNEVTKAIPTRNGTLEKIGNMVKWGGRVASLTNTGTAMAWATAEVATNPELRYILGRNLEAIGKWSPKLQEAYAAGGAKAVNVLVNTLNQTDPEFRQAHAGSQQVSPYQEGAEKPQIKKPELSRDEFLKNLGGVESAGKYDATNPNSSATGKYQFLWKTWGDDVSKWAGAPISQQMFLRTPALQDAYMKHHHDTTLMQGAKTLRSTSPNAANRSDTELKSLIHFKGLEGARKYLDTGTDDTSANNMNVEDYIKRVGGGA